MHFHVFGDHLIEILNNASNREIFERIRGLGVSDIAIDDIHIIQGSECAFIPEIARPIEIITSSSTTPSTPMRTYTWLSQSGYDCNFEVDFCTWTNDITANFN